MWGFGLLPAETNINIHLLTLSESIAKMKIWKLKNMKNNFIIFLIQNLLKNIVIKGEAT